MTTVTPSKIKDFDPSSLEKMAYNSVKNIPTHEPNDRNRLGYNVWVFLKDRQGSIEQAIKNSGSRILISEKEAAAIIVQELKNAGVELP
jgi:hypothetical protein